MGSSKLFSSSCTNKFVCGPISEGWSNCQLLQDSVKASACGIVSFSFYDYLIYFLSFSMSFMFLKLELSTGPHSSCFVIFMQIFDDLDLPFARLKLLPKGGHGGHNG